MPKRATLRNQIRSTFRAITAKAQENITFIVNNMPRGANRINQNYSRAFFELIRSIGASKSKQEEDKIIDQEVIILKNLMLQKDAAANPKLMKELLLRMLYCEMLGHPTEFGYINAVKLSACGDMAQKRVGYIAVMLCVQPTDQLMLLMISNIQKDIKSANVVDVCVALGACCKIRGAELVGCVVSDVVNSLNHSNEMVRKKAVTALHSFWKSTPALLSAHQSGPNGLSLTPARTALCDTSPAVMGASLNLLHDLCVAAPAEHTDLLPSFVDILRQILEHRLSREYDYHRLPAPWLQCKLLRILSILCSADPDLAPSVFDVVSEAMKRADIGLNIGHAVTFEAVRTITSIAAPSSLLESAAEAVSKFLTASTPNLRYLGIASLVSIVRIDSRYAQRHQGLVIDCLDDADASIRTKTLDLLYAMCNADNVQVIVLRLLRLLKSTKDSYSRRDIVTNVCALAERHGPSNRWYVETMNEVLSAASDVSSDNVHTLLSLIAEGSGDDEDEDEVLRKYCVVNYFYMLGNENRAKPFSSTFRRVMVWVLGEYGFLYTAGRGVLDVIDLLVDFCDHLHDDHHTVAVVVTAISKLCSTLPGGLPPLVRSLMASLSLSSSTSVQQRAQELLDLAKNPQLYAAVVPVDGYCDETEIDEALTFLSELVRLSIENGAKPYHRTEVSSLAAESSLGLRTQEYQRELPPDVLALVDSAGAAEPELVLASSTKRWGVETAEEPVPSPVKEEVGPLGPVDAVPYVEEEAQAEAQSSKSARRKKTEKDRLADALFGHSSSSTTGGLRTRKSKPKISRAVNPLTQGTAAGTTSDLFAMPSQVPAPSPAAPSQTTGDFLSDVFGPASPAPAPVNASTADDFFTSLPTPAPSAVSVSLRKIPRGGQAIVEASISNASPVKIICTAPSGVDVAPADPVQLNAAASGTQNVSFTLSATQVSPSFGTVQVTVTPSTGTACTQSVQLSVADFLSPKVCEIDFFGGQWGSHTAEGSTMISQAWAASPDTAASHLAHALNFHTVQVIGAELCSAAIFGSSGMLILCHFAAGAPGRATIRSTDAALTTAIVSSLSSAV